MYDIIKDIWKNPGAAYSPMPLWRWNDTLDGDTLVKQLDDFHKKGVDGVVIQPYRGMSGAEYLSEEYFSLLRDICAEAKRRFMLIVICDDAGAVHGRITAEDKRLAERKLYARPMSETAADGEELLYRMFVKFEDGKLIDTKLGAADGYDGYNFILGYTGSTIRGVSSCDNEDGAYPAADCLNGYAAELAIKYTFEQYHAQLGEYFGGTIIGFCTCAPKTGVRADDGIMWSYSMIEEFFECGGDITQLAHLIFEPKEKKLRREAEHVYHQASRRNLNSAYYLQLSQWCREHGVALMGEVSEASDCGSFEHLHIPGQRLVGQCMKENESVMPKLAADHARHGGISRSSCICFEKCGRDMENPWDITPDDMMKQMNFLFARGCSMIMPHYFAYSLRTPLQSDDSPADVGQSSVWWKDYRKISGYIKRMSWLGATGTNNPQAAVLCSSEYVPLNPVKPLYENGYTFNYLTLEHFMEKAHIHDGEIHIDRYAYDILLIDGRLRLDADIVKKIGHFVTQGGKMYRGSDFVGFMKKNVKLRSYFEGEAHGDLRTVHYTKSGCEFFLFVNEGETDINGHLITAISCAANDFDPFTGKINALVGEMTDGGFAYELELPAHTVKVIGFDPDSLPKLGKADEYSLLEIVSLAEGRMKFDHTPDENKTAVLSFVDIHDTAEITVNGEEAGRLIVRPYRCDITKFLHGGENEIEVKVTGSPANVYVKAVKTGFEGCTVRIYEKIK